MDKLYFLTAGVPLRAGTKGYKKGFEIHDEMGLDGLELEFVHGVRISDKSREDVANAVKTEGKIITAHAPFYRGNQARACLQPGQCKVPSAGNSYRPWKSRKSASYVRSAGCPG